MLNKKKNMKKCVLNSNSHHSDGKFVSFQLKGSIDDCSCNIDTVDYFNNNKIFPRLKSLLLHDYFRFYKVNLKKDCPFWADDSKCAMRSCHVHTCEDKDVPEGLKGQHQREHVSFKVFNIFLKIPEFIR